jgi:hypothetical protein
MGVCVCLQASTRAATKALEVLNKEVVKKQRWVHQTHVSPLDAMFVAMFEVMVFVPGWLEKQEDALLRTLPPGERGGLSRAQLHPWGLHSLRLLALSRCEEVLPIEKWWDHGVCCHGWSHSPI